MLNALWMMIVGCGYFVATESNMRAEYKVEMRQECLLDDVLLLNKDTMETDKEVAAIEIGQC